ncbi:MAG: MFS transporter [Nocardioides sp.]
MTSRSGAGRLLLGLAALAVAFAAADTYVVVLALPEMMGAVGIPIDQLQRAAPIISGFLLGYVAMVPLIGRISDLRGRVPVLVLSLGIFALGSLITALAYDVPSMVGGRFLQGVGGGGLVPATLALVADLYPPERRGVPLGVVSAVQEIGSVLGPLFGAAVVMLADWRVIFLINLVVGALIAQAIRSLAGGDNDDSSPHSGPGARGAPVIGLLLAAATVATGALVFVRPGPLMRDLTWGAIFVPITGSGRWLTPIGLVCIAALALFLVHCLRSTRPLVDLRGWWAAAREADLVGAVLLALTLSGVIVAFATADPRVQVFSPQGRWYLAASAVCCAVFVLHVRRAEQPIIPRGTFAPPAAWGALLVSFFIGAALIAALIDIPIFARTTIYASSQVLAALVLVRFLIALPVGAIVGGFLLRRFGAGPITCAGMLLAAVAFLLFTRWDIDSLRHWTATFPLLLGGFGFGLALAPVNAAVLATTPDDSHGLATALVVVSRMVGMLVGISALTTIGLRRYYAEQRVILPVREVCDGKSRCPEFTRLLKEAGIVQEHAVFLGAAGCAVIAALLALVLFRRVSATPTTPSTWV